jgi:hypothetical protein
MIKVGKGPVGLAGGLFGKTDGKGSVAQNGVLGQKMPITAGDPMSRTMNQLGKGHSYLQPDTGGAPSMGNQSGGDPTMAPTSATAMHPGISEIRGSGDAIKKNPRSGGLADTKEAMPTTAMSD